ncbi:2,3-dihydroxy-2,3-dihydrophenylpropionate dehydrogenase [Anopheles sinensis]|uniref:2,3-dihydroxy-2,3-dihydrophenylpropionate dehydrogenase n=1 Tax=Anopheles sinensis TaxID=74873 RepID=A0A084W4N2_ANOSI|nr:2,3-dihydroxy-2,3-dihydrophenylpropionate dehydrogenase [Anopheles sinensis]
MTPEPFYALSRVPRAQPMQHVAFQQLPLPLIIRRCSSVEAKVHQHDATTEPTEQGPVWHPFCIRLPTETDGDGGRVLQIDLPNLSPELGRKSFVRTLPASAFCGAAAFFHPTTICSD